MQLRHPVCRIGDPPGCASKVTIDGFELSPVGILTRAYLEQHVFLPLQMMDTTARQPLPAAWLPLASSGYDRASAPPTLQSMANATIHEAGSTGVVSTAEDIGRFMRALLDPPAGFLSARTVALMREPQIRTPHGFVGLGLYAPLATGANAFVGHDGGSGGLHGSLGLVPDRHFGVLVFYNSTGIPNSVTPEGELLEAISARYFNDAEMNASTPPRGAVLAWRSSARGTRCGRVAGARGRRNPSCPLSRS